MESHKEAQRGVVTCPRSHSTRARQGPQTSLLLVLRARVQGLSRRRKERACIFQAERDSSRLAITSSAGTPRPPESPSPSFMTSSLGWAPAQRLVPGINTSWQGPRPPCLPARPSQAALPSRTSTHCLPPSPRQSPVVAACRHSPRAGSEPRNLQGAQAYSLLQAHLGCVTASGKSIQIQTPPQTPCPRGTAGKASLSYSFLL